MTLYELFNECHKTIAIFALFVFANTRNITKLSVTPTDPEKFPEIVSRAYNLAMMGRKGGVIIDFPFNVQKADCNCR